MQERAEGERLSWEREDIERKLSIPAGKFTSVNTLFTLFCGILLGAIFYASLLPFRHTWVGTMFYERGSIPFAIVLLSGWTLAILVVKWLKLEVQTKALSLRIVPESHDYVLSPVTANEIIRKLIGSVDDTKHFILFNRIHRSLGALKNMGRVSDVDDVLRSQADNDESFVESTYTLPNGLLWAIPILGFIGTVVGLSGALGGFGGLLSGASEISQIKTGLQSVTRDLAVAFETTLIALVAALGLQIAATFLKKKEQEFLDGCSDYCHSNIVSKVRIILIRKDKGEVREEDEA